MDLEGVASALSSSSVSSGISIGLLKMTENLDSAVAAQLAASIGLGTVVDAFA